MLIGDRSAVQLRLRGLLFCTLLHDLWTNTCGLVGVARAFGMVSYACVTKCEKCEKAKHAHYVEKTQACFWTPQNAKIWSFLKMTTHFICFAIGAAALSRTHLSRRGLHGVEVAFTLLRFAPGSYSSFFLAPITNCNFEVVTMRLLPPLQHWER